MEGERAMSWRCLQVAADCVEDLPAPCGLGDDDGLLSAAPRHGGVMRRMSSDQDGQNPWTQPTERTHDVSALEIVWEEDDSGRGARDRVRAQDSARSPRTDTCALKVLLETIERLGIIRYDGDKEWWRLGVLSR